MELDALKSDESLLGRELETAGAQFRGPGLRTCACPLCKEKHPSAGIYLHDQHWFYKCNSRGFHGTFLDVRAKLSRRTVAEELRAMNDSNAKRQAAPPPKIYPTV